MRQDRLKRLTGAGLALVGLALMAVVGVSLLWAAPPPPGPKAPPPPHPGPGPGPVPHPGPHVVNPPGPHPPVVLPRIRPLLVRRLGPKVVVEYAGTVVRTVAQPVVVTSVQSLEKVPASDFSKSTAGKVLKVSEDFTVVVDVQGQKTPVRLIGLEPADAEQAPPLYRREAQRFFQNLLAGEFVYLESDPGVAEKDEAGNTAAYLYRAPDGLLVNLEAVRQGYAVASDYTCKHEKLFNFYEAKAQADGKGIWAPPPATRPADRPRPPARMERAVPPAPER